MTDLFDQPDDATPLEEEEKLELIPTYITFRNELNLAEHENIAKAKAWACVVAIGWSSLRLEVVYKFVGAWNIQYATAISPETTNKTGRVKSPTSNNRPPTSSIQAPIQKIEPPAAGIRAADELLRTVLDEISARSCGRA